MRDRLQDEFIDLGEKELKNIARPVRAYAIKTGPGRPAVATQASAPEKTGPPRLSIVVSLSPTSAATQSKSTSSMA